MHFRCYCAGNKSKCCDLLAQRRLNRQGLEFGVSSSVVAQATRFIAAELNQICAVSVSSARYMLQDAMETAAVLRQKWALVCLVDRCNRSDALYQDSFKV